MIASLVTKKIPAKIRDIEAINIDRHIDFDFAELISKKYNLR